MTGRNTWTFATCVKIDLRTSGSALPLKLYTSRYGSLNLVNKLPETYCTPDLCPKMYMAYGKAADVETATTNLHLDICCAMNVMVCVVDVDDVPIDYQKAGDVHFQAKNASVCTFNLPCVCNSYIIFDITIAMFEAIIECGYNGTAGIEMIRKRNDIGALWHIFKAEDVGKLRVFLRQEATAAGCNVGSSDDPIHDQTWYLNSDKREKLKLEHGVECYSILQRVGDAVFVPVGCPHQVRNLNNCMKVGLDFVSPQHLKKCLHLSQEFRLFSKKHTNHADKLQIKIVQYHAVKDAVFVILRDDAYRACASPSYPASPVINANRVRQLRMYHGDDGPSVGTYFTPPASPISRSWTPDISGEGYYSSEMMNIGDSRDCHESFPPTHDSAVGAHIEKTKSSHKSIFCQQNGMADTNDVTRIMTPMSQEEMPSTTAMEISSPEVPMSPPLCIPQLDRHLRLICPSPASLPPKGMDEADKQRLISKMGNNTTTFSNTPKFVAPNIRLEELRSEGVQFRDLQQEFKYAAAKWATKVDDPLEGVNITFMDIPDGCKQKLLPTLVVLKRIDLQMPDFDPPKQMGRRRCKHCFMNMGHYFYYCPRCTKQPAAFYPTVVNSWNKYVSDHDKLFICYLQHCNKIFPTNYDRARHILETHQKTVFPAARLAEVIGNENRGGGVSTAANGE